MSKHYYQKAIPQMAIRDSKGEKIPFEALTQSHGFLELDDEDPRHKEWVTELETAMKARRGGVEKITAGQFSELYVQKKTTWLPSLPNWLGGQGGEGRDLLTPGHQITQDTSGRRAVAGEAEKSQNQPTAPIPLKPIIQDPRPAVGKLPPKPVPIE